MEIFAGDKEVSAKLWQDWVLQVGFVESSLFHVWFVEEGHAGAAVDIVANPMVFDLTSTVGFCLALNSVLRLRPRGVLIVALCCESFTVRRLVCIFCSGSLVFKCS